MNNNVAVAIDATVEIVQGEFKYKIFGDNEYSVCVFHSEGGNVKVVGNGVPQVKGMPYNLYGKWEENSKFGKQFVMDYYEQVPPNDKKAFIGYMKSLHCGIGAVKARMIWDRFGVGIWDVIDDDPKQLMTIKGVTKKNVDRLTKAVAETHVMRDLMRLFGSKIGITTEKAKKLLDAFGKSVIAIIKKNTYEVCKVKGFGFPTVDKMALMLGQLPACRERIVAALNYVLDLKVASGDICTELNFLIDYTYRILNAGFGSEVVSVDDIKMALHHEWKEERLMYSTQSIYKRNMYNFEGRSAGDIFRLSVAKMESKNVDKAIEVFEEKEGITLAECQKKAVAGVFGSPVSIITGGPGTGKSTIIKCILACHKAAYGKESYPVLLAPTAKAARRMTEVSGCEATTIHSAVGYNGTEFVDGTTIDGNLIIVDEMSMVDQFIFSALLNLIEDGARLVMVGDPDQLPSVGAGEVLYQLLHSKSIPITKLEVVFRQQGDNLIVDNAIRINSGNPEIVEGEKYGFIEANGDQGTFDSAINMYMDFIKVDGIDNTVLLCPQRRKTERNPILSVETLNQALQEIINPKQEGEIEAYSNKLTFRKGDKVMQTKNTEQAKNGDVGRITSIEYEADEDDKTDKRLVVTVRFEDGIDVEFEESDLINLDLAYATTVHKSQGSEYKNVIIVLSMTHSLMLTRKLLYTAVTRAKEYVVAIGNRCAYQQAVLNTNEQHRRTFLAARIFGEFKKYNEKKS